MNTVLATEAESSTVYTEPYTQGTIIPPEATNDSIETIWEMSRDYLYGDEEKFDDNTVVKSQDWILGLLIGLALALSVASIMILSGGLSWFNIELSLFKTLGLSLVPILFLGVVFIAFSICLAKDTTAVLENEKREHADKTTVARIEKLKKYMTEHYNLGNLSNKETRKLFNRFLFTPAGGKADIALTSMDPESSVALEVSLLPGSTQMITVTKFC